MNRLLLASILLVTVCGTCQAQPLREVLKSEQLRALDNQTRHSRRAKHEARKQADQTNFDKVFNKSDGGPRNLLDWLGRPDDELYIPGATSVRIHKDFALAERRYALPKQGLNIHLTVLVPAPENIAAVQYGLFKEASALLPPINRKEDEAEKLKHGQFEAELFSDKENQCALVVKLTKGTIFNLSTPVCEKRAELIKLMEQLDLKRLNRKLDT